MLGGVLFCCRRRRDFVRRLAAKRLCRGRRHAHGGRQKDRQSHARLHHNILFGIVCVTSPEFAHGLVSRCTSRRSESVFMSAVGLRHALRLAPRRAFAPVLQKLGSTTPRYVSTPRAFIHTSVPQSHSFRPSLGLNACPSCSRPLPSPVPACTNCWNIFSLPPDISHHELLGLSYEPNPFSVDLSALKHQFRQAQAVCHPDAWASKGAVSFCYFLGGSMNRSCCRTSRILHKPCRPE
jgi:hypothetical protein